MPEDQHDALGRLASVLAGSREQAAQLLAEVALLDRRSSSAEDERYEERRALLVQRVLRQRAASAADLDPTEPPPVVTRLALLDPLPRTALVLRYGEHLTLAELARITDRSPAAITRALEQTGSEPRLEPYEIEQALGNAVPPEPGAVRDAERRFGARRRRTHTRVVLAGLAAVALVVGLTALPGLLRTDPYVRAYGEWTSAVKLAPQGPFTFQARQLSAAEEVLGAARVDQPDSTCRVTVTTSQARTEVPTGRTATVGERAARFVDATDEKDAGLWWSVGPRTSALAQCDQDSTDASLLDLAGQVQFAPTPIRVPFDFRGLSSGDEVHTYLDASGTTGVLVTPRGQNEESPDAVFVHLVASSDAGAVSGRRVDILGSPGWLTDDVDQTSACWTPGTTLACAIIINSDTSVSRAAQARRASRVLATARSVRLVPDLTNRASWLDARDAFPR